MRRAAALGTILALTVTVGACGKKSDDVEAGGGSAGATSAAPATAGGTAGDQAGSSTDGGGTPQEAVTNVFHALAADDAEKACRQMAYGSTDKKPVPSDPGQLAGCKTNVSAAAQQIPAEQKPVLGLVTVTSAKEDGDTATVEGKDISAGGQTLEKMVSQPITLTRIDGRWYVDVSSMWTLAAGMGGGSVPTS